MGPKSVVETTRAVSDVRAGVCNGQMKNQKARLPHARYNYGLEASWEGTIRIPVRLEC